MKYESYDRRENDITNLLRRDASRSKSGRNFGGVWSLVGGMEVSEEPALEGLLPTL